MPQPTPQTALRAFLYGGAATLLAFDLYYLVKSLFTTNYAPIIPLVAGILTAGGLLFIVYAEHQAREADKRDHRRISRVAHQLENPLKSLQSDLEELIASADKLPTETRLKLKRMETRATILHENVRDVFLMLQAQEHPLAKEVRTYNACTLVEQVIREQKKQAQARNVELLHKMHCADAPVRLDQRLFKIAVTHVIENAMHYTMKPGMINVAILKSDKAVRVVVQDRGIGIKKVDAPAVFQPFARGREAHKYDPDGIGVGLTLSRLIIQEVGGKLRWKNRENSLGTQFEIVLPLAKTR